VTQAVLQDEIIPRHRLVLHVLS